MSNWFPKCICDFFLKEGFLKLFTTYGARVELLGGGGGGGLWMLAGRNGFAKPGRGEVPMTCFIPTLVLLS